MINPTREIHIVQYTCDLFSTCRRTPDRIKSFQFTSKLVWRLAEACHVRTRFGCNLELSSSTNWLSWRKGEARMQFKLIYLCSSLEQKIRFWSTHPLMCFSILTSAHTLLWILCVFRVIKWASDLGKREWDEDITCPVLIASDKLLLACSRTWFILYTRSRIAHVSLPQLSTGGICAWPEAVKMRKINQENGVRAWRHFFELRQRSKLNRKHRVNTRIHEFEKDW